MSGRAASWLLAAVLLLAAGCDRRDRSPEGAVRALVAAADAMEPDKVYELLSEPTRRELSRRAELATRQTGGGKRIRPEEMLISGLGKPELALARVAVLSRGESAARVRLHAAGKKETEDLDLVKEKGRWRVRLALGERP